MRTPQYARVLRRWWWLFIASTIIGGVSAYAASTQLTPTFRATATMLVVNQQTPGLIVRNDLETSALLANTFSEMMTVRPVLEDAIRRGELPVSAGALRGSLRINSVAETQLLEVTAESADPLLARDMANVLSEVFIDSEQLALTSGVGRVTVIEPATTPAAPVSPNLNLNALLGALLGLTASAGLIVIYEHIDDTVKSPRDVRDLAGLPTLGEVGTFPRTARPADQLQVALSPQSPLAEAYRTLRTNLGQTMSRGAGDQPRVRSLLVTGAGRGDGKSTTVANVAVVFGLAGHRVVVVDADLRAPTQYRIFSLDNSDGLTMLLHSPAASVRGTVQQTPHANVSVLTSGPVPANPSELLGSARMREVLDELQEEYDLILLDSPPVVGVTDPVVLAGIVDSMVLVARAGRTRTNDLRISLEQLAASGTPVAGVVLNRSPRGDRVRNYGVRVDRDAAAAAALEQPQGAASVSAALDEQPSRAQTQQAGG